MRRPLFWMGFVFLSSMAAFLRFSPQAAAAICALAAVLAWLISDFRPKRRALLSFLCCAALGAVWCEGFMAVKSAYLAPIVTDESTVSSLVMTVTECDGETGYCRLGGRADITANGAVRRADITLSGYFADAVQRGSAISCEAVMTNASPLKYKLKGAVMPLERSPHRFMAWQTAAQRFIAARLYSMFGDKAAGGVACALLSGDKSRLLPEVTADFRKSALSHMLVVSGMHLVLISGLIKRILAPFCSKRRCALASLALCWAFAAVCQMGVSVVRAAVMLTIIELAEISGRRGDTLTSLAVSAVAVSLPQPEALFSASFLLSFSAVAGLAVLERPMFRLLGGERLKSKALKSAVGSVSAASAAQLATLPVSAALFGTAALLGVISNLCAVWLLSPVMLLAVLALLLGMIAPFAAALPVIFCTALIRLMLLVAHIFAGIPFAGAGFCEHWQFAWLAGSALLAVILLAKRADINTGRLAAALCAGIYLTASLVSGVLAYNRADILIFDGGGCAAVVKSGHAILFGSPQNGYQTDNISDALAALGTNSIDAVILSSPDEACYQTVALLKGHPDAVICCEPDRYITSFCRTAKIKLAALPTSSQLFRTINIARKNNATEISFYNGRVLKSGGGCVIIGKYTLPRQLYGAVRIRVAV